MKGAVLLVHQDTNLRLQLAVTIAAREIGVVPVETIADALFACTAAKPAAVAIEPDQLANERGGRLSTRFSEAAGQPVRVIALTHTPSVLESDAMRRHGATSLLYPLHDQRLADNLEVLVESTTGNMPVPAAKPLEPSPAAKAARSQTILVVDDSETIRTVVSKFLAAEGFRVFTASHAANALRMVGSGVPIHLVVSDLLMPGMDGFELKQEIDRGRDRPMPFLLMTGEATPENREIAMKLGSSDFIAKPIQKEPLLRAVEKLLAG